MSWPYLPTNPECSANPCNSTPTTSDLLTYAGPNLPCTGINSCDTLSVSLQKIDEQICLLKEQIVLINAALALTTTTTTTTL
jgi:hypothetical protein